MIIIKDYGVELHQLTEDKIELVRRWRTDPKISKYMEYRGEITPEMQKKWFDKIQTGKQNYYFLINVDGKEVGLINIKDIDYTESKGESGIFIWDTTCRHSGVAVKAGLCLYDFIFDVVRLEKLEARIYNTNPTSIKYHNKFGFSLEENEPTVLSASKNQLYLLSSSEYKERKEKLKMNISKITPPIRLEIVLVSIPSSMEVTCHSFSYAA